MDTGLCVKRLLKKACVEFERIATAACQSVRRNQGSLNASNTDTAQRRTGDALYAHKYLRAVRTQPVSATQGGWPHSRTVLLTPRDNLFVIAAACFLPRLLTTPHASTAVPTETALMGRGGREGTRALRRRAVRDAKQCCVTAAADDYTEDIKHSTSAHIQHLASAAEYEPKYALAAGRSLARLAATSPGHAKVCCHSLHCLSARDVTQQQLWP